MSSNSHELFTQPGVPTWPRPNTLADRVLRRLLAGEHLTQISFGTTHWRLAAYINQLRKLGWEVHSCRVRARGIRGTISRYWLPGCVATGPSGQLSLFLPAGEAVYR